jgi:hypothetical protein
MRWFQRGRAKPAALPVLGGRMMPLLPVGRSIARGREDGQQTKECGASLLAPQTVLVALITMPLRSSFRAWTAPSLAASARPFS